MSTEKVSTVDQALKLAGEQLVKGMMVVIRPGKDGDYYVDSQPMNDDKRRRLSELVGMLRSGSTPLSGYGVVVANSVEKVAEKGLNYSTMCHLIVSPFTREVGHRRDPANPGRFISIAQEGFTAQIFFVGDPLKDHIVRRKPSSEVLKVQGVVPWVEEVYTTPSTIVVSLVTKSEEKR